MFETQVNYLAILAAAAASWIVGAVWYGALSKPWLVAVERTREQVKATGQKPWIPFVLSFLLEIVMAYVLARVIDAQGEATLGSGLLVGFAMWAGFVFPATAVNYLYPARKPMLTVLDTGHWLLVLLAQGAVLGLMP
jgi:hypothetical protein